MYLFTALIHRNKNIEQVIYRIVQPIRLPRICATILYIIVSPVIVFVEELYFFVHMYFAIRAVKRDLCPNNLSMLDQTKNIFAKMIIGSMPIKCPEPEVVPFHALTDEQKAIYDRYYNDFFWQNKGRLTFMARESSIQLVYQNAIVIYDFVYPPVHEMDYSDQMMTPRAVWITGITLQLISILLSSYSTFSAIIEHYTIKYSAKEEKPGLLLYLVKVLQVITHVVISTTVVYMTVIFLHRDERWKNLRFYLLEEYGEKQVTFIFGFIIWIICPMMFAIQYVLLGMVLSNGPFKKSWKIFLRTIKSMIHQLLIIHDNSVFEWKDSKAEEMWWAILKMILGYTLYMAPIGFLFIIFSMASSKESVCRNLYAPFLLDNNQIPSPFVHEDGNITNLSFSELYDLRKTYGSGKELWEGGLAWGFIDEDMNEDITARYTVEHHLHVLVINRSLSDNYWIACK